MKPELLKIVQLMSRTPLTFDELTEEIHKTCIVSTWCCFHDLRKQGLISVHNESGQLVFSLTAAGTIYLESQGGTLCENL